MPDGYDDRVIGRCGGTRNRAKPALALAFVGVGMRVVNIDQRMAGAQFVDYLAHARVAQVRTVLLERRAQHEDAAADDADLLERHQAQDLRRDVRAHALVDAPRCADQLGVDAHFAGLVDQIVGVDADAMPADETGSEIEKIPLCRGGLEHFLGIDSQAREDQRKFVDQGNVHVALRVFDGLGRFGDADARRAIGSGANDAAIQRVDEIGNLRRRARGHLDDIGQPARLVARVDPFGAVAAEKIAIEAQSGGAFERRHATVLGRAGVDSRFIDDECAAGHGLPDHFAGADQWPQIGPLMRRDRCRHGDDEDVCLAQIRWVGAVTQLRRCVEFRLVDFTGDILPLLELRDAHAVDIEADRRKLAPERDSQRQADVTQANHGDSRLVESHVEVPGVRRLAHADRRCTLRPRPMP